VVVTPAGDRFSRFGWRFQGDAQPVTAARWAEAERRAREAEEAAAVALEEVRRADGLLAQTTERWAAADRALRDRRSEVHDGTARLDRNEAELGGVDRSADDARRELAELEARMVADREEMARLDRALADYQAGHAERLERRAEMDASRRSLEDRAEALRSRRTELEISAGRWKERQELLAARLADLESRRRSLGERRFAELERRRGLALTVEATGRLEQIVDRCLERLESVSRELSGKQSLQRERVASLDRSLDELRRQHGEKEQSLAGVRERARRLELEHAEVRLRAEAVVESLRRELDAGPEEALSAEPPELPAGATVGQRVRELDRELRLLGPVNPLAVTELEALSERATFLEGQLEDVRSSRRELGKVIRTIDAEIMEVFAGTYADTAGHFEQLCATLFPGGMGRLRLTDPDDLLRTGVDLEARPAGKQVRRLSLLSGGERSLVAMAFLFAVFRSRPSPFYLMDEVEAALDDVNLVSFLELVRDFKDEAQLILVTHQKRTMEAGDCLYGITMRPGEPSQVVSERVDAGV
jgi:chromosome segregation protein